MLHAVMKVADQTSSLVPKSAAKRHVQLLRTVSFGNALPRRWRILVWIPFARLPKVRVGDFVGKSNILYEPVESWLSAWSTWVWQTRKHTLGDLQ